MPLQQLFDIANRFENNIARALIAAFGEIRSQAVFLQLVEAMRQRGVVGALEILNNIEIDAHIRAALTTNLEDAIRDSGRFAIELLPSGVVASTTPFVFSSTFGQISNVIQNYDFALVQRISQQTREAIREAVQNDFIAGQNPVRTARVFRDTVGLTPRQERAVRNYERALRERNPVVLRRALRDRRFDPTLRRAIENDIPLSEQQIQRFTQRYRERYIAYRARTIARTESLRAIGIGQHYSIVQGAQQGLFNANEIRRFWVVTRDARTRPAHRNIPALNPQGVGIDEAFVTPLGPLLYPRDPNGSAANTIQCRCGVVYRQVMPGETIEFPPMTHNVRREAA